MNNYSNHSKKERLVNFKKWMREIKKMGTPKGYKFKIHRWSGEDVANLVGKGHSKLYPDDENVIGEKYVNYEGRGKPELELQVNQSDCQRYVNIQQVLSHHRWSCAQQVTITVGDLEKILRAVKGRRNGK